MSALCTRFTTLLCMLVFVGFIPKHLSSMASHSPDASFRFDRIGQDHPFLSDTVIGAVLPRRQTSYDYIASVSLGSRGRASTRRTGEEVTRSPRAADGQQSLGGDMERIKAARLARRREQLRVCQARFRKKQRDLKLQKQQHQKKELQQLRNTIQCLKLERQSLKLRGKFKPSPFNVVSEVLHFIDTTLHSPWRVANPEVMKSHTDTRRSLALLQTVLTPDVAMGELRGFDVLMEQLQRYSQFFGEPQIQLDRIETLTPGVLRATTTLSLTITETTLHLVLRQAEKARLRLLNERLRCSCSINFLFDGETGRVERLEPCIDFIPPLLRILKDMGGVTNLLENALLTPEGVLGESASNRKSAE